MWLSRLLIALIVFALCAPVEAQQPKKIPRIGYLSAGSPSSASPNEAAFLQGLRDLGYIDGQNIAIEYRFPSKNVERYTDLVADLVRLKVDIIVAAGGTPSALAAKKATRTIPIVMASTGDPVASGLVASLAHPGGNITGLTFMSPELSGKQLELLKEVLPHVTRVAVLANANNPENEVALKGMEVPASSLGLKLQIIKVSGPDELSDAFSRMTKLHASALTMPSDPILGRSRQQIVDLAAKNRLPAMYPRRAYVEAGGLMSYGSDLDVQYRRAATYVDKILKGAKPADLPVEAPMKFEFIINLKAAKQIGLTIPQSVLYRADKVIK